MSLASLTTIHFTRLCGTKASCQRFQMRGISLFLTVLAVLTPLKTNAGWTALARTTPGPVGLMLLLTDGTVIAQNSNTSNAWYRLTPDSHGSYVNGTWSTIAAMHNTRLYYSSAVLTNGKVFIAGGEYGNGTSTAEVYDPLTNTWTLAPASGQSFYDSMSKLISNGNVLITPVVPSPGGSSIIYNVANNTWIPGPQLFRGNDQDEASWVKLADDSIITIDPFGTHSERYIPTTNTWINDSDVPTSLYDPYGDEMGPAFLLPDGRAFFLGSTGHTAFYAPTGNTSPGTWTAGPDIPNNSGMPDAAAAMMVNGKILCAVSPAPTSAQHFPTPTSFYEFDYTTNTFTQVSGPTGTTENNPTYQTTMLCLPDGTVLHARFTNQLYVYTPTGTPLAAGKPTITSLTKNADGSFHLVGTLLNGISEGACYGDDWQMSTNYPIVRLTDGSGNVRYARTYNFSSTGVMTGATPLTTDLTLPAGLPSGSYSLVTTANGIASDPITFTLGPIVVTASSSATEGSAPVNASLTLPYAPTTDTVVSLSSNLTSRATVPASVTVLAGQTSASFQITTVNNSFLDGNEDATITASASGYPSGSAVITIVDDESAIITVTTNNSFNSSGNFGGPFTPFSFSWTITNTGNTTLNWSASVAVPWLNVSPETGTLNAGKNVQVTVSLNSSANALAAGVSTDSVLFQNTTNNVGNTSRSVNVSVVPAVPALTMSPYTKGTSNTFSWTASSGVTGYTAQVSTSATFATVLATQTPSTSTVNFSGLNSGTLYYYRVLATAGTLNSAYSNIVSSTQDATVPLIAITNPSPVITYTTTHPSLVVQGTASDSISGLSAVTVNGQTASTSDGFAHWSVVVPLSTGPNTITASATDRAQPGGNVGIANLSVTMSPSTQNDGIPDSWKIAHGIDPSGNAPASGPSGDPDRDGVPNFLEYAFHTDPQSPGLIPGSSSIQINAADSQPYLQLSYVRLIGALDLVYTVEVSDDLIAWSAPGGMVQILSVSANGDGASETVTVRINSPVNSTVKKFAHVRVTSQ